MKKKIYAEWSKDGKRLRIFFPKESFVRELVRLKDDDYVVEISSDRTMELVGAIEKAEVEA